MFNIMKIYYNERMNAISVGEFLRIDGLSAAPATNRSLVLDFLDFPMHFGPELNLTFGLSMLVLLQVLYKYTGIRDESTRLLASRTWRFWLAFTLLLFCFFSSALLMLMHGLGYIAREVLNVMFSPVSSSGYSSSGMEVLLSGVSIVMTLVTAIVIWVSKSAITDIRRIERRIEGKKPELDRIASDIRSIDSRLVLWNYKFRLLTAALRLDRENRDTLHANPENSGDGESFVRNLLCELYAPFEHNEEHFNKIIHTYTKIENSHSTAYFTDDERLYFSLLADFFEELDRAISSHPDTVRSIVSFKTVDNDRIKNDVIEMAKSFRRIAGDLERERASFAQKVSPKFPGSDCKETHTPVDISFANFFSLLFNKIFGSWPKKR